MKKKRSKNKKKRSKNRIKYNNKFNQIVILSTHHNNQNKLIFPSGNIHKGNYRNIKIPEFKIYNFVKNNNNCEINNEYFKNEHSHKNVIPFIEYCFPNISILPILVGELNNFEEIGNNLFKEFKNTLWIFNTDLLHVNGHHSFKLNKKNINIKINELESEIMEPILERKKDHTICGLSVLKLFLCIPFVNLIGKVSCYYQSNQIDYIKKNVLNKQDKKDSVVSYLGCYFVKKNNNELDNLLTKFEELELIEYSKSVLNNKFNKNKIYKPFKSPSFKFKKGVFVTLKNNNKLRGCIGIIIPPSMIFNNVDDS